MMVTNYQVVVVFQSYDDVMSVELLRTFRTEVSAINYTKFLEKNTVPHPLYSMSFWVIPVVAPYELPVLLLRDSLVEITVSTYQDPYNLSTYYKPVIKFINKNTMELYNTIKIETGYPTEQEALERGKRTFDTWYPNFKYLIEEDYE